MSSVAPGASDDICLSLWISGYSTGWRATHLQAHTHLSFFGAQAYTRRPTSCLAYRPQLSGRGIGPRSSRGTLQLSTRCSSLALPPSRSFPVREGSTRTRLTSLSLFEAPPAGANPTCVISIIVMPPKVRSIVEGNIGIPFWASRLPRYDSPQCEHPVTAFQSVSADTTEFFSAPRAASWLFAEH